MRDRGLDMENLIEFAIADAEKHGVTFITATVNQARFCLAAARLANAMNRAFLLDEDGTDEASDEVRALDAEGRVLTLAYRKALEECDVHL